MKRIFLLGYMGVGKTTIGKELSKRLSLSFVDLDHNIEARYHQSIRLLFEEKGEESFRKIENLMLREVAMFEDIVVSTGGGTPCFFDSMTLMNEVGTTVYLMASPSALAQKLERFVSSRPVLGGRKGPELLSFITESIEQRNPFYTQAHITFDVETMNAPDDVQRLLEALREREAIG